MWKTFERIRLNLRSPRLSHDTIYRAPSPHGVSRSPTRHTAASREPKRAERAPALPICEPTRAATALHLTPTSGDEPHTTVRISRSRRRWNPTTMSESKEIARTTCEQTAAESGQMCRKNESSARAMLALWVSIWRRARRKSTFGMAWKVAGSAKCARCAFESPPM